MKCHLSNLKNPIPFSIYFINYISFPIEFKPILNPYNNSIPIPQASSQILFKNSDPDTQNDSLIRFGTPGLARFVCFIFPMEAQ